MVCVTGQEGVSKDMEEILNNPAAFKMIRVVGRGIRSKRWSVCLWYVLCRHMQLLVALVGVQQPGSATIPAADFFLDRKNPSHTIRT